MTDDTRDRVIRLEEKVAQLSRDIADTHKKVGAMYELLLQAKGVRWTIVASAAIASALVTLFVNASKVLTWLSTFPR